MNTPNNRRRKEPCEKEEMSEIVKSEYRDREEFFSKATKHTDEQEMRPEDRPMGGTV